MFRYCMNEQCLGCRRDTKLDPSQLHCPACAEPTRLFAVDPYELATVDLGSVVYCGICHRELTGLDPWSRGAHVATCSKAHYVALPQPPKKERGHSPYRQPRLDSDGQGDREERP